MLIWFGHVERMDGRKFSTHIYVGSVNETHVKGQVKSRYMKRLMDVDEAKEKCQGPSKWNKVVSP